jgi:hypothetical protein
MMLVYNLLQNVDMRSLCILFKQLCPCIDDSMGEKAASG